MRTVVKQDPIVVNKAWPVALYIWLTKAQRGGYKQVGDLLKLAREQAYEEGVSRDYFREMVDEDLEQHP